MGSQIDASIEILRSFLALKLKGANPQVDRPEIVAHAVLSGLAHHWPEKVSDQERALLEQTLEIKLVERSRWMTQRRIAIAKLARAFE